MASSLLSTTWAVCGIAAAAARFVPVPLLDDVVRSRATQLAVVRTLRAHDRTYPSELLSPLWGEPEGRGPAWRRRLRRLATRLLLFPLRKPRALFGAVRGVPHDVLRVVLLARSLDRVLDRGGLTRPDQVPDEARALRSAVDEAVEGADLRLLVAGLADGLSRTRGLRRAAVAFARQRLSAGPDAGVEAEGALADGAERVTEVLRRPEIAELLERFDARVDVALARPA